MTKVTRLLAAVGIALSPLFAAAASGTEPSSKPVRFIIPLGPGSGADTSTRFLADLYSTNAGRTTIAENRPGGDMVIAVQDLLSSPADGTAILYLTPTSVVINPVLRNDLPYNAQKDIRPIAWISRSFAVMVVRQDSPYRSVPDLVAAAKAKPGTLSFANYGHHYRLGAVSFEKATGAQFVHVPYKGAAQANNDVVGGAVDVHVTDIGGAMPLIQSGKLRPLAVTGRERHPFLPDVPTIAESGYPDFNLYVWTGFGIRADTPEPVAKKLEGELLKAINSDAYQAYNQQQGGAEIVGTSGESLAKHIASEVERYRALVK